MPNGNSPSGEAAQTPASATSKRGLGREAQAELLRVGIGPECPKCNQSELTWAIKPDWNSCHVKSSNIRHHQDCAQNKGWNRISRLQTIPSSDRQPELEGSEGANRSPRETLSTKLEAGSFAN